MASFAPYCDPIVATPAAKDIGVDEVLFECTLSCGSACEGSWLLSR